jgi:hypothetical protein
VDKKFELRAEDDDAIPNPPDGEEGKGPSSSRPGILLAPAISVGPSFVIISIVFFDTLFLLLPAAVEEPAAPVTSDDAEFVLDDNVEAGAEPSLPGRESISEV